MKQIGTTTNGNKIIELTEKELSSIEDSCFSSYMEWKHKKHKTALDKEVHLGIAEEYYTIFNEINPV